MLIYHNNNVCSIQKNSFFKNFFYFNNFSGKVSESSNVCDR